MNTAPARLAPATLDLIDRVWSARWGTPVITPRGSVLPFEVEGLVAVDARGDVLGLVTWAVLDGVAEIVSLDALVPGRGIGSRLLAEAERILFARGFSSILLCTSNDNVEALGFYLRRGWRLVAVHLDGMDAVRRQKPGVPTVGKNGIPLRDIWDLRKEAPR